MFCLQAVPLHCHSFQIYQQMCRPIEKPESFFVIFFLLKLINYLSLEFDDFLYQ